MPLSRRAVSIVPMQRDLPPAAVASLVLDAGTPDAASADARALRIAVVTETYPPEVNGVAATLARVVHGLHDRGHVLQLVRPQQGDADAAEAIERRHEVLVPGLPIPRYPQLKMGLPAARRLRALWTGWRPDVVHVVTEGPLGHSALRAARSLGLPVVSDFRTNFHSYTSHYGLAFLGTPLMAWLRHFHNRTACTMVPTAALKRELAAQGFERLEVVARGVDTRLFDPARRSDELRRRWGAGPRSMVLLYVGRLAAEKNLGLVLDAFEDVRAADPSARLVLVGDGPAAEELRARCPGAVFAGLRRGDDLAAHYASADLFLFPSLTETWGNVVPEAMASALPVAAFDCAAAAELIRHGESGLLAPVAPVPDGAAWLAAVRRLAADLPRARTLGAEARQRALALGWDRIVAQVEGVYRRARRETVLPTGALAGAQIPWA